MFFTLEKYVFQEQQLFYDTEDGNVFSELRIISVGRDLLFLDVIVPGTVVMLCFR